MWKYVLKRIGLALITAFIILSISFLLIKLLPFSKPLGNDDTRYAYYLTQQNLGFVNIYGLEVPELGAYLDRGTTSSGTVFYCYEVPAFTQYIRWLTNIVTRWDWGVSTYINPNNPAMLIIASKLPTTIVVNFFSVIVSVPLGILLGVIAALKKNKPTDHVIST